MEEGDASRSAKPLVAVANVEICSSSLKIERTGSEPYSDRRREGGRREGVRTSKGMIVRCGRREEEEEKKDEEREGERKTGRRG